MSLFRIMSWGSRLTSRNTGARYYCSPPLSDVALLLASTVAVVTVYRLLGSWFSFSLSAFLYFDDSHSPVATTFLFSSKLFMGEATISFLLFFLPFFFLLVPFILLCFRFPLLPRSRLFFFPWHCSFSRCFFSSFPFSLSLFLLLCAPLFSLYLSSIFSASSHLSIYLFRRRWRWCRWRRCRRRWRKAGAFRQVFSACSLRSTMFPFFLFSSSQFAISQPSSSIALRLFRHPFLILYIRRF